MNAPERSELWVLQDGEKKLTVNKDTKIVNTANFVIKKEDHTMGNLLRMWVIPVPPSTLSSHAPSAPFP